MCSGAARSARIVLVFVLNLRLYTYSPLNNSGLKVFEVLQAFFIYSRRINKLENQNHEDEL